MKGKAGVGGGIVDVGGWWIRAKSKGTVQGFLQQTMLQTSRKGGLSGPHVSANQWVLL